MVREENKDHVFVQTFGSEFVLREVELGDEVSDRRVVVNGISANETIVLDGAFHLNNKRHQDQIKGAGLMRALIASVLHQRLVIVVVSLHFARLWAQCRQTAFGRRVP